MLTEYEFEKAKELYVKCEYCRFNTLRINDKLVDKTVCQKCSLNGIEGKLKYAVKKTKFEPTDIWINAVRSLIKK